MLECVWVGVREQLTWDSASKRGREINFIPREAPLCKQEQAWPVALLPAQVSQCFPAQPVQCYSPGLEFLLIPVHLSHALSL